MGPENRLQVKSPYCLYIWNLYFFFISNDPITSPNSSEPATPGELLAHLSKLICYQCMYVSRSTLLCLSVCPYYVMVCTLTPVCSQGTLGTFTWYIHTVRSTELTYTPLLTHRVSSKTTTTTTTSPPSPLKQQQQQVLHLL